MFKIGEVIMLQQLLGLAFSFLHILTDESVTSVPTEEPGNV